MTNAPDPLREQLSAYCDGELPADARRFLQARLNHDGALRGTLERWQLLGDVLRAQPVLVQPPATRDAVLKAIQPPARRSRWPLGAAGLAAGVFALMIGLAPASTEPPPPAPAFVVTPVAPAFDSPQMAVSSGAASVPSGAFELADVTAVNSAHLADPIPTQQVPSRPWPRRGVVDENAFAVGYHAPAGWPPPPQPR